MPVAGPLGYPDFGRYQQQAATLIINDAAVAIQNTKTFPAVYVGNLQSVTVAYIFNGGPTVPLSVGFYDDQACTVPTGGKVVVSDFMNTCYAAAPVLGSWMQIVIQCGAVGPGPFYNLLVQGMAAKVTSLERAGGSLIQTNNFAAIPAGGFQVYRIPYSCDGSASAGFNSGQPLGELHIQQYDYVNATWVSVIVVRRDNASNLGSATGYLDCVPTRMIAANYAGVATNISGSLVFGA